MGPGIEYPLLTDREPNEILVHNELMDCPYIDGEIARLPIRAPTRSLTREELDSRLCRGDRRHGTALYTPECPNCRACEAIRLNLADYRPNKTHRRIFRKGGKVLRVTSGSLVANQSRVDLYNKHLYGRGLLCLDEEPLTLSRYRNFILTNMIPSFEIRLFLGDSLVGVAITDCGATALSAHYTFYDPDYAHLSLGTYAILQQVQIAEWLSMQYVYLGLYVEKSVHMRYKARFHPHERLVGGDWRRFDGSGAD